MIARTVRTLTLLLAAINLSVERGDARTSLRVLEIRSYNLKPGSRERFHQLVERDAMPMLHRWKVDVVAYGPSRTDSTTYFLMRAFPSVADRQRSEDAFYGSAEWKDGPRAAILAEIENYTTVVLQVDEATIDGMRRATSPGGK